MINNKKMSVLFCVALSVSFQSNAMFLKTFAMAFRNRGLQRMFTKLPNRYSGHNLALGVLMRRTEKVNPVSLYFNPMGAEKLAETLIDAMPLEMFNELAHLGQLYEKAYGDSNLLEETDLKAKEWFENLSEDDFKEPEV